MSLEKYKLPKTELEKERARLIGRREFYRQYLGDIEAHIDRLDKLIKEGEDETKTDNT